MIRSLHPALVLRLSFMDNCIKLDKKKYPEDHSWSIALITAHNPAIKTVILAVIISPSPIVDNISRVFTVVLKVFP
jgi:hypothetical protein